MCLLLILTGFHLSKSTLKFEVHRGHIGQTTVSHSDQ